MNPNPISYIYMTEYLSRKIKILSAISIIMVLYIHMYYTEGSSMPILRIVEGSIGQGICTVAVPLFYIISGYLFFLKMPKGIRSIPKKLRKRVRTLLIPYIIANILTFVFYVALNLLIWKMPSLGNVVNFRVLDNAIEAGPWNTFCLIFIDPPIAFQLWFVRDLMVAMICSPVIYLLLRWIMPRGAKYILLLVLLVLIGCPNHIPCLSAFIWFTLEGYIAICNIRTDYMPAHNIVYSLFLLYIITSIVNQCSDTPSYTAKFIPILGIPAIWYLYDIIVKRCNELKNVQIIKWLASYTFFVYLCHEPLLNIFKKLPLLISRSETILITSYILTPVIFYIFACCLGRLIKAISPKIYYVYTGGR